ncbi:MAG: rRNA maturation RNase YbeY [Gemmatimonadota bacterium]|nr:rRNA maturation RNase YbeY [Gemmatimonadota bacterium]
MITGLLEQHGVRQAEVSLTFIGAARIRTLNRRYLGTDRVTDVISFDLSGSGQPEGGATGPGTGKPQTLVGDIYVCVPQAKKQAARLGATHTEELFRLAAHGVLHLLGYDHEIDAEKQEMNRLQERLVGEYCSPGR